MHDIVSISACSCRGWPQRFMNNRIKKHRNGYHMFRTVSVGTRKPIKNQSNMRKLTVNADDTEVQTLNSCQGPKHGSCGTFRGSFLETFLGTKYVYAAWNMSETVGEPVLGHSRFIAHIHISGPQNATQMSHTFCASAPDDRWVLRIICKVICKDYMQRPIRTAETWCFSRFLVFRKRVFRTVVNC